MGHFGLEGNYKVWAENLHFSFEGFGFRVKGCVRVTYNMKQLAWCILQTVVGCRV